MGYRNITVTDEVYARLAALKAVGESFNALLARLTSGSVKRKTIKDFVGAWKMSDAEAREFKSDLKSIWGAADARFRH